MTRLMSCCRLHAAMTQTPTSNRMSARRRESLCVNVIASLSLSGRGVLERGETRDLASEERERRAGSSRRTTELTLQSYIRANRWDNLNVNGIVSLPQKKEPPDSISRSTRWRPGGHGDPDSR